MTMVSGFEAQGEMRELLDELYGGPDWARLDEAEERRRHAARREARRLRGEQERTQGGYQPSRVEVRTRQECRGERKQITLLATHRS